MTIHALTVVLVGLGATLFMDLWAVLIQRAFGVAPANYCLVGRWVCHMPRGIFMHASIVNASKLPLECAVGWISHYAIGVSYALVLIALVSDGWLEQPTLLPALLFGVGTVLVPFLIMHPSFGLGVAASRTPNPGRARLKSLMAHTAFGVGLYACALASSRLLPAQLAHAAT